MQAIAVRRTLNSAFLRTLAGRPAAVGASGSRVRPSAICHLLCRIQVFSMSSNIASEMQEQEQAIANLHVAIRLAYQEGRLNDAARAAKECTEAIKAYYGEKHPAYASALNNDALIRKQLGEMEAATELFHDALKVYESVFGKGQAHQSVASVLQNVGLLHLTSADKKKGVERMMAVDEARSYLDEAFQMREKLHGPEHQLTAVAKYQLASAAARQRRYDEAEKLCKAAVTDLKKTVGEAHASTATAVNNLGWILKERGQLDRAVDAYREALELRRALHGPAHQDAIATQHNLAECLRAAGKEEEAQALQRDILRLLGQPEEEASPASAAGPAA